MSLIWCNPIYYIFFYTVYIGIKSNDSMADPSLKYILFVVDYYFNEAKMC